MDAKETREVKTINSITFNKDCPVDRDVISKINQYCDLEENAGLPSTSAIRNFLLRKLSEVLNTKDVTQQKQAG